MKKFLLLGMLIGMLSCMKKSSSSFIPDDILVGFNNTYPEAEKVKWNVADNYYLVRFKEGKEMKEAIYQKDGTFVKEE